MIAALIGLITRFGWMIGAGIAALKVLVVGLILYYFPGVIKTILLWWAGVMMSLVNSITGGTSVSALTIEFTGLLGYFAYHLQFDDIFAILISAMIAKFTLKMVKIV